MQVARLYAKFLRSMVYVIIFSQGCTLNTMWYFFYCETSNSIGSFELYVKATALLTTQPTPAKNSFCTGLHSQLAAFVVIQQRIRALFPLLEYVAFSN